MADKWKPTPRAASVVAGITMSLEGHYLNWKDGITPDVHFNLVLKQHIERLKNLTQRVEGCVKATEAEEEFITPPCGSCGAEHGEPCRLEFKEHLQ